MTSVQAVFPNAIANWTDRVDQENIVFAVDPNSLAAEIIAVETILGENPQIEKNPILGNPVNYGTVDARISAVQQAQQLPYCELTNPGISVRNTSFTPNEPVAGAANGAGGAFNTYQQTNDPFKMYNNADVTIPVDGWYFIEARQTWAWWDNGWDRIGVYANGWGNLLVEQYFRWDIPGNVNGGAFWHRDEVTTAQWMGTLAAGTRISVASENGTSQASQKVTQMAMKIFCATKINNSFVVVF